MTFYHNLFDISYTKWLIKWLKIIVLNWNPGLTNSLKPKDILSAEYYTEKNRTVCIDLTTDTINRLSKYLLINFLWIDSSMKGVIISALEELVLSAEHLSDLDLWLLVSNPPESDWSFESEIGDFRLASFCHSCSTTELIWKNYVIFGQSKSPCLKGHCWGFWVIFWAGGALGRLNEKLRKGVNSSTVSNLWLGGPPEADLCLSGHGEGEGCCYDNYDLWWLRSHTHRTRQSN